MGGKRAGAEPVGVLPTGEQYFAPMGKMRRDGDRVQCHLCGRWLQQVGGSHLVAAHGITAEEYRELFGLFRTATTAAPELSQRKAELMRAQFTSGERAPVVGRVQPPPTVSSWRSLALRRPDLLAEWDWDRNTVSPSEIGTSSEQKVWWRCRDCLGAWEASPKARTVDGYGCRACGRERKRVATIKRNKAWTPAPERRLARLRPEIAAEWHPQRNGKLSPSDVSIASTKLVWWLCSTPGCGREWSAVISDRVRSKGGCPQCANKRAGRVRAVPRAGESFGDARPDLLDEWHPTRNAGVTPFDLKRGSEQVVWWRCRYCSAEWERAPYVRIRSVQGGCWRCAVRLARGVPVERVAER